MDRWPQFGIFAQGAQAHHFLAFDLRPGSDPAKLVRSFRRLRVPEVSAGGANLVVAFAAGVWRDVAPWDAPDSMRDFAPVTGPAGRGSPSTQHDAWLWLSAGTPDVTFDRARAAVSLLADVAVVADEQTGFVYQGGRDITGFIDGTANPPPLHAPEVALVGPGEAGAGGSHVLTMRWIHDLEAFDRLPVQDQERVIGRTKTASVELPDTDKPETAHIARVQVEEQGRELEIFRRSVPYGTVAEHGLNFLAFSRERRRFDVLLARMFGSTADPTHDRLTDFSRPVAAACYFAPSLSTLHDLAGPEPDA